MFINMLNMYYVYIKIYVGRVYEGVNIVCENLAVMRQPLAFRERKRVT